MVEVPESISIDIGIVDAEIYNNGWNIRFAGKGETTNVGKRIDSPTKGISIPSIFKPIEVTRKTKTKKHVKPRYRHDLESLVSLKGIRW